MLYASTIDAVALCQPPQVGCETARAGIKIMTGAALDFPVGRAAPIIATQSWEILVDAEGGTLSLKHGGNRLVIDGHPEP